MTVVTGAVFTAYERVSEPALTVTVAGRITTVGLVVTSVTTAPPMGAGALNVIVAVADLLPTTEVGVSVNEARLALVDALVPVWTLYMYENPSEDCPGIEVPI